MEEERVSLFIIPQQEALCRGVTILPTAATAYESAWLRKKLEVGWDTAADLRLHQGHWSCCIPRAAGGPAAKRTGCKGTCGVDQNISNKISSPIKLHTFFFLLSFNRQFYGNCSVFREPYKSSLKSPRLPEKYCWLLPKLFITIKSFRLEKTVKIIKSNHHL